MNKTSYNFSCEKLKKTKKENIFRNIKSELLNEPPMPSSEDVYTKITEKHIVVSGDIEVTYLLKKSLTDAQTQTELSKATEKLASKLSVEKFIDLSRDNMLIVRLNTLLENVIELTDLNIHSIDIFDRTVQKLNEKEVIEDKHVSSYSMGPEGLKEDVTLGNEAGQQ